MYSVQISDHTTAFTCFGSSDECRYNQSRHHNLRYRHQRWQCKYEHNHKDHNHDYNNYDHDNCYHDDSLAWRLHVLLHDSDEAGCWKNHFATCWASSRLAK